MYHLIVWTSKNLNVLLKNADTTSISYAIYTDCIHSRGHELRKQFRSSQPLQVLNIFEQGAFINIVFDTGLFLTIENDIFCLSWLD